MRIVVNPSSAARAGVLVDYRPAHSVPQQNYDRLLAGVVVLVMPSLVIPGGMAYGHGFMPFLNSRFIATARHNLLGHARETIKILHPLTRGYLGVEKIVLSERSDIALMYLEQRPRDAKPLTFSQRELTRTDNVLLCALLEGKTSDERGTEIATRRFSNLARIGSFLASDYIVAHCEDGTTLPMSAYNIAQVHPGLSGAPIVDVANLQVQGMHISGEPGSDLSASHTRQMLCEELEILKKKLISS